MSSSTREAEAEDIDDYDGERYPFRNDCYQKLTLLDKVQIAIMSITIAPIKLLFIAIFLMLLWPFAYITTKDLNEENRHEPLKGWRRKLIPLMRLLSRAVFFSGGFYRMRVTGALDRATPIVVVAPHTGYFDSVVFVWANFLSSVARAGTEDVPVFGRVVRVFKPIVVNREKSASRSDTVQKLLERVRRSDETRDAHGPHASEWPLIGLFPQGTCSNQRAMIRFKSGAFIAGRSVQPVCIRYSNLKFDSITWTWDGPNVYALAWLTLCQLYIDLEVHILSPYVPSDDEKNNADLYADNVRCLMAKHLDMPISELSYEDGRLMTQMTQYGLPKHCGLIRVYTIKKTFRVNDEDIEGLIPQFASIANKSTGLCHLDTFAESLSLKMSTQIENVFKQFDTTNSGFFKFKNFVEAYFENVRPKFDTINIEKFVESLDKFKASNNNQDVFYTFEEFNQELKTRFNFEFINDNLFKEYDLNKLGRDNIQKFFTQHKLHLYIFSTTTK